MKHLRIALIGAIFLMTLSVAPILTAATLKMVIHEDSSAEGDPLPPISRYNALKRSLETAIGRPIEISLTRDRQRVYSSMEHNQADVYITNAADLAARALTSLGYDFIASGRPDATVLFIGRGAAVENLKAFAGMAIALPRADTMFGQVCAAELRDFVGQRFAPRHSSEYSAVVYAVENSVVPVGCIPSIARARETLDSKGLKILYEGRPQPALPVIASPGLPAGDRNTIAKVLSSYTDTPAGDAILKALGVTSFTEGGETRLRVLNEWLKAK